MTFDPSTIRPAGVDPSCFTLFPLEVARRLRVAPVAVDGDHVTVLTTAAADLFVFDDLRLALPRHKIDSHVVDGDLIDAVLKRWSRLHAAEREGAAVRELHAERSGTDDTDDDSEDGQLAQLVWQMLDAAIELGASDVHFEPIEDHLEIRFRVDGVLRHHATHPGSLWEGVTNRLKVLTELNLSERRVPQDGRFSRQAQGRQVDCRVVTLPNAWDTEGAVVRLFDQDRGVQTLDQIGFGPRLREAMQKVLATPHGAFLVTGPTGHGKTTTLYAALGIVATADRKTLAIEDPTEIRFPAVTQMQVNEKAKLSFSTALRAFLRADPDVILVGEVRDDETAQLATRAAMTGHLVLSSMHTNTAAGAVARLVNLGVDRDIVAESVKAVLSQRLVRRLCTICRQPYTPTADDLTDAGWPAHLPTPTTLYRAGDTECVTCAGTGYSGRFAVGELLVVTPEIAEAIEQRASARELARLAADAGTVPMRTDALEHVAEGLTSLAELSRLGV